MPLAIHSTGKPTTILLLLRRQCVGKSTFTSGGLLNRIAHVLRASLSLPIPPPLIYCPPFFSDRSTSYAPIAYISGSPTISTMQETRILAPHQLLPSPPPRHHHLLEHGKQKRANLDQASAFEIRASFMSVHSNSNTNISLSHWARASMLKHLLASASLPIIFILALPSVISRLAPESSSTVLSLKWLTLAHPLKFNHHQPHPIE